MERRIKGQKAEQAATDYLQKQGLTLVQRNFYCRQGELDLIMEEQSTLVFVEVRSRREGALVSAAESVTWRKQQRLIAAARFYLHRYGGHHRPCRFDVVCVSASAPEQAEIHWIQDAFDAS